MCSWFALCTGAGSARAAAVPDITTIQRTLVALGDRPVSFVGSRDWIGCIEASLVLEALYAVPCRIVHIRRGSDLPYHAAALATHFAQHGTVAMMGGNLDCMAKILLGIRYTPLAAAALPDVQLLVLDPHYVRAAERDAAQRGVEDTGLGRHCRWESAFDPTSFYNICLPIATDAIQRASSAPQS